MKERTVETALVFPLPPQYTKPTKLNRNCDTKTVILSKTWAT